MGLVQSLPDQASLVEESETVDFGDRQLRKLPWLNVEHDTLRSTVAVSQSNCSGAWPSLQAPVRCLMLVSSGLERLLYSQNMSVVLELRRVFWTY